MSGGGASSTRNFIAMQNRYDRVVLLVDMDCFYCQVEEKLDPSLQGQPLAVVQYNAWRGGGIIAVNYAARAKGVTRHMRGDEAKEQCPDIRLVKVPNVREKADLTKYREAGKDVANVLQRFTPLLERASVDEAYLDITDSVNKRLESMNSGSFVLQPQELVNTYAVGHNHIGEYVNTITTRLAKPPDELVIDDFQFAHDASDAAVRQSDLRLLIGASIASEIRAAVKSATGYDCSAGIAHNKILAKLACGINKPNKQTILPLVQIPLLFETLPVGKIKGLGAKFGEEVCERTGIRFLGQLLKFTEKELQRKFDEKNGTWLYNICRGIDLEAVTPRFYSKSIGCCKKFPGRNNITGLKTLKHWLGELAREINERLEKDIVENNRRAKQMVVSFVQEFDGEEVSSSRSAPLNSYDTEPLAQHSLEVIKANTKTFLRAGSEAVLNNPIKFLGISVGKFETITQGQSKLQAMFANQAAQRKKSLDEGAQSGTNEHGPSAGTAELAAKKPEMNTTKSREDAKKKSFFANYLVTSKPAATISKPEGSDQAQSSVSAQQCDVKSFSAERPVEQEPGHKAEGNRSGAKFDKRDADAAKSFFVRALQQKSESERTSPPTAESAAPETVPERRNPDDARATIVLGTKEPQLPQLARDRSSGAASRSELDASDKPASFNRKRKFEEVGGDCDAVRDGDNSKPPVDYKARFVEFAVPELRPEFLQFTECEMCGVQVHADERSLQTHRDQHFAQQLSEQQRQEYREEMKARLTARTKKTPPNNAKRKSPAAPAVAAAAAAAAAAITTANATAGQASSKGSTPKTQASTTTGITKFFKQKGTANGTTPVTADTADVVTCGDCNLPIPRADWEEHKDYHLAKELQRKLNRLEVHTVAITKKTKSNAPSATGGNTSLNASRSQRGGSVASKPITQFFSQANT